MYLGGIISQLISNYKIWEIESSQGLITSPKLPSTSFFISIKAVFDFPYGLYGIGITLLIFFILIFVVMRLGVNDGNEYDRDRNLIYSNKGTYGTAGFMPKEEIAKVLELTTNIKNSSGTILGTIDKDIVCVPPKSRMNKNIAVYGAAGSMKSRAFARNMVFQCVKRGESLAITDPKSELYEDLSEYLRNEGYVVMAFNLVNPEHSDSWNCLQEVQGQEIMAQIFVSVIIKNTGDEKGDHFWDNAESNLLRALVLYVSTNYDDNAKNIGEVYKLLTTKTETELNSIFSTLDVGHPARAPYSIFQQASDSVRTGIIIGLGARLQVFQSKIIRDITSHNEIDLELMGKKKCAYFCITSDQDSTFDFLSSLFLSFLFIKLVRYADKNGIDGRLPVEVHILADELANIGVIPDLTKKISTVRSRGISMSVIFQNLAQMQNRYPNNAWLEIIGNCDTQLFLGCTDELTATFISNRTGDATVGVESTAKQLNSLRVSDYTPDYRETNSVGNRKLMMPDEILRFPIEKALIILRGQKVFKVDKYDYTNHPDSKKLVKSKATDHIPNWRKLDSATNSKSEADDYTPIKLDFPNKAPKRKSKKVLKSPTVKKSDYEEREIVADEIAELVEIEKPKTKKEMPKEETTEKQAVAEEIEKVKAKAISKEKKAATTKVIKETETILEKEVVELTELSIEDLL